LRIWMEEDIGKTDEWGEDAKWISRELTRILSGLTRFFFPEIFRENQGSEARRRKKHFSQPAGAVAFIRVKPTGTPL
jgi:hypothetical protein